MTCTFSNLNRGRRALVPAGLPREGLDCPHLGGQVPASAGTVHYCVGAQCGCPLAASEPPHKATHSKGKATGGGGACLALQGHIRVTFPWERPPTTRCCAEGQSLERAL